jgi:trehalose 6-phosphate synthase/phosphatase
MHNSNRRLIVISNRLPAKLRATSHGWRSEKSTGGLATAMNPILRDRGGLWIGWPGESAESDDPKRQEVLRKWRQEGLVPIDLSADTAEHFYEGYCNQTLWPLFHHFPSRVAFDPQGWTAYRSANEIFRDAAVQEYRERRRKPPPDAGESNSPGAQEVNQLVKHQEFQALSPAERKRFLEEQ